MVVPTRPGAPEISGSWEREMAEILSRAFRESHHLGFGLLDSRRMLGCFLCCLVSALSVWRLLGSTSIGIRLASSGTDNLERSSSYRLT